MAPVTESELRSVVHLEVNERGLSASARVVDEFVIGETGRLDIALIDGAIEGFELKSDLDSLHRLPRQMEVFGQVCTTCTLVVTPRHLRSARGQLRRGWGLAVVNRDDSGSLAFTQVRKPQRLRSGTKPAIAELLWRDEALRLLDERDLASGMRSKTREELQRQLCQVMSVDELRTAVVRVLMERQGWRDELPQREDAATSLRQGASSRFLARRLH